MPVRMIRVGRPPRRPDAHQPDGVRRRVGQRVEAVGQNADRPARVAERNLRDGDRDVQEQNADEDSRDRGVS